MVNRSQIKIVAASMVGNILEFYDFMLFGFLSPLLAPLFFPSSDPLTSLIMALATYGVGYFMRPLGAIFFGHLGDRYGRKKALSSSIILMSIPTVLMALLPTYDQIGIAASIILITLRLLQGFCTGGEYNGAGLYVVENTDKTKTSFYGSLITISSAIGGILGVLVSSIVTASCMPPYACRFSFLLGGCIGAIGLYMRKKLSESSAQNYSSSSRKIPFPLRRALADYPHSIISTMGIAACSGAMYNISFTYMSVFLNTHAQWQLSNSLILMSLGTFFYILTVPIVGLLADKYGNRPIMITGAVATFLLIYPLFSFLLSADSIYEVIGVQICLAILSSWFQAPMNAYMAKLFPIHMRYSGVAFSYSIGMAIFGGTTPVICTLLIQKTGNHLSPAFYILALSVIGFCAVKFSKEQPLDQ